MTIPIEQILRSQLPNTLPIKGLVQAAVAICLRQRNGYLELLLMQRALDDNDPWSGQICLPGGRHEMTDDSTLTTALREAREEVGINLDKEKFLGQCNDHLAPIVFSKKQIHVSTYVFMVSVKNRTKLNNEVGASMWVPLKDLADKKYLRSFKHPSDNTLTMEGIALKPLSLQNKEPVIWGLTLRILLQFSSKIDIPLTANL